MQWWNVANYNLLKYCAEKNDYFDVLYLGILIFPTLFLHSTTCIW